MLGATAEATPVAPAVTPTPTRIRCETVTLADGRTLTGILYATRQAITRISKTSGTSLGTMTLSATDIVSRTPRDITVATRKPRGSDGQWLDNDTVALASAHATHRPILIDVPGSDWCPWCITLHRGVLNTPVFKAWAVQHVILLLADVPHDIPQLATVVQQNKHQAGVYAITGYPTVHVIDATGATLAVSCSNSLVAQAWIAEVRQHTTRWQ